MMKKLTINVSPHVYSPMDTRYMMKGVIKALVPGIIASVYFFRWQAVWVFIASVAGCLVTEYLLQKLRKRKIRLDDYSAVVTGLLLAMIQPPSEVADITASETAPKTATELQDDANTQPQVSIPPAVTSLPTSGFSLQVHSLHTQQDANRAVAEFKQKGFPSYQRLITNRDGTRWHVVFLGPFEDIETAWDTADTILEREQWRTILRTHSP